MTPEPMNEYLLVEKLDSDLTPTQAQLAAGVQRKEKQGLYEVKAVGSGFIRADGTFTPIADLGIKVGMVVWCSAPQLFRKAEVHGTEYNFYPADHVVGRFPQLESVVVDE